MTTTTAAARRAASAAAHRARAASCPTNRLLDVLGDKWVPLILKELSVGPLRYNALSRAVAGASQKMLTQTLRSLEHDGLVARTTAPDIPPSVTYSLTPLGKSLLPVLATLTAWAESHMPDIDQARTA
ncbi:helix-turn-helix transcriptional regulator [Actinocorallia sp. API 0066]|uniref:winged helix-turn-helix transcriptional regulator n=1 Tax=Actinocorallia sp. API 0066 TaxID=2896846 RepID=UPI001E52C42B|nr:helix-turn-helix domain-containing protein [Actinocorallia sp. API 0066]MCD0452180.1 helix-turn-helix transcriptional regulator [Actinocorallia sp. API 0066]